jgi:hypothetical protein
MNLITNTFSLAVDSASLSLLILPYDGLFEYMLCEQFPQHTFYLLEPAIIWKEALNVTKKCKNALIIQSLQELPKCHAVIINDRHQQYDIVKGFCDAWGILLIQVEHLYNPEAIRKEDLEALKHRKCDLRVSVSEEVNTLWGKVDYTIPYGIKSVECPNKKNQLLVMTTDNVAADNIQSEIGIPVECLNPHINILAQLKRCRHFLYLLNKTNSKLPLYYALAHKCRTYTNIFQHATVMTELDRFTQDFNKNTIEMMNHDSYFNTYFPIDKFKSGWEEIFSKVRVLVHNR